MGCRDLRLRLPRDDLGSIAIPIGRRSPSSIKAVRKDRLRRMVHVGMATDPRPTSNFRVGFGQVLIGGNGSIKTGDNITQRPSNLCTAPPTLYGTLRLQTERSIQCAKIRHYTRILDIMMQRNALVIANLHFSSHLSLQSSSNEQGSPLASSTKVEGDVGGR